MGSFYRPTREELIAIKRKADTWQKIEEKFGFYIEPIVTEEARGYVFYKNLDTGDIYVDDRGNSFNKGLLFYCYYNEEEEKMILFEAIEKVNNGESVNYPVVNTWKN